MKKRIQSFLQKLLGFENYLFVFSLFKIYTLRWDGQNREGDFNYFLTLLKKEDHVLDIGANIGIMSGLMAKKCTQGQVFAFEPIPENCRALLRIKKTLKLSNIQLHSLALGNKRGEVRMEMPIMEGVRMQGLSHVEHETIEGYEGKGLRYTAVQLPLDELDFLQELRISAIKMDVENYEQFVLEGGIQLLKKDRPIIYCELWDNENRRRCFTILSKLDYVFYVLFQDQLVPFEKSLHTHHNFFFFPKERTKEFL